MMRILKRWAVACGPIFLLSLIILSITGCTIVPYGPHEAPLYQLPQQSLGLPPLGLSYSVAAFDSEHLAWVEVENYPDISYDCRLFGLALRDTLGDSLRKTGRFTQLGASNVSSRILISGRVDKLSVRNNFRVGPGPSAKGTVSYEVRVGDNSAEPVIRDTIQREVIYPDPEADFHLALDALRLQLAYDIAKRIVEDKRLPEIAGQVGAAGSSPSGDDGEKPEKKGEVAQAAEKKSSPLPEKDYIGLRWAVVIGISSYQDTRIPSLRYASKDAQAFYDWLISSDGGRYSPSHVLLLLDQDATGVKIKEALFGWLKRSLEEDMVTIYFAGHGSPESPDSFNNLFLLPYDVEYDNIASTGFPMWDIETALKRFIKARKVVVIADACHAGGVGQSFDIARRANMVIEINPISSGLSNLSTIADGVAIISASADNQFSQESRDWGGGHGVFTYFLLEGLHGQADYNNDRSVNLGELNLYLSEQVRRATRNAQSPVVSGKFDPALTIGK